MICPECSGNGFIRLPGEPDPWETTQNPFALEREVNCPTCEGQGVLSDEPAPNHCPSCGEPLKDGEAWCDEHEAAERLGVPTYPALCVICNGNGFNEVSEYSFARLKFETIQVPCADCDGRGYENADIS